MLVAQKTAAKDEPTEKDMYEDRVYLQTSCKC